MFVKILIRVLVKEKVRTDVDFIVSDDVQIFVLLYTKSSSKFFQVYDNRKLLSN